MADWNELFSAARPAFNQRRSFERARTLGLSALACLGRKTITQMLCASGQQFEDWSAAYRLFERERFETAALWRVVLGSVLEALPEKRPVVALIDDTLTRKKGKKIEGTSWRRDPLGPHFTNNFIWASRYLQLSIALPQFTATGVSPARAIPVDLQHCPSPRKPLKKAGEEAWKAWREASADSKISTRGAERIEHLRSALDEEPAGCARELWICADATFTNRTVLKRLPERTLLIGRIRKDARLYALPTPEEQNCGRGRKRCYGRRLPTPEELRRDQTIPWQKVQAFAAGRTFDFDIKSIAPVRWKAAGGEAKLKLIIVRPLAYRARKRAPMSYRQPAYLICTDPSVSDAEILQSYLWRWEIEVNFRDEKTLVGLGKAQVRTRSAIESVSALIVFAYALLLLAVDRNRLLHRPLPRPLWQRPDPKRESARITTPQAISLLRADLWSESLGISNKNSFVTRATRAAKPLLIQKSLKDAVLYASE